MSIAPVQILLVTKDLIFESKIIGSARVMDRTAIAMPSIDRTPAMVSDQTMLVIVDLADPAIGETHLRELRACLPPAATLLAYGSHVDVDRLRVARAAGCDPVLPRSAFVERLPEILAAIPPAPPSHAPTA